MNKATPTTDVTMTVARTVMIVSTKHLLSAGCVDFVYFLAGLKADLVSGIVGPNVPSVERTFAFIDDNPLTFRYNPGLFLHLGNRACGMMVEVSPSFEEEYSNDKINQPFHQPLPPESICLKMSSMVVGLRLLTSSIEPRKAAARPTIMIRNNIVFQSFLFAI